MGRAKADGINEKTPEGTITRPVPQRPELSSPARFVNSTSDEWTTLSAASAANRALAENRRRDSADKTRLMRQWLGEHSQDSSVFFGSGRRAPRQRATAACGSRVVNPFLMGS